jgi:DNA repair protein RecO (recombination protein O)
MMVKTRAIVVNSFKFGENKMIVDIFTECQGRVSFIVPLSSSSKAKIKKQFFQPLSILEVEYDYRQKNSLQHLKEVRIYYPYSSVPFNSFKLAVSLFLAEFLNYAIRSEQENQSLFDFLVLSLQWFDNCKSGFANFHLVFMLQILNYLGFYPNLEDYKDGCVFDMQSGCYSVFAPLHRNFIPASLAKVISTLARMNYSNMHLFMMNREDRNQIVAYLLQYYRLHVPDFPELKSLDVVKTLFK